MLANIYTADPYFRVPLFVQFTYVSVWWQWDRKQNTGGFFCDAGARRWAACAGRPLFRPAAFRRGLETAVLGLERVDARREAGQLARNRILVKHALGDRPMQLRLRQLKRGSRRLLVAGCDRRLDLFDEGAHPTGPGPIDRRPLGCLTNALFR
jgi:hypothetical protein